MGARVASGAARVLTLVSVLAGALWGGPSVGACTTAVISGAATVGGRPLLWKNRDADDLDNRVLYCTDGRFPYLGLVNSGDAAGLQIWAGMNSEGFAIMNAASYNLEKKDTLGEGAFMKLALQSCSTVGDFQTLLEKTDEGGRDTSSNFGVIDAHGGAAYFEVSRHAYKRFNADDPAIAPRGFLVRTNYSLSNAQQAGTGYLRDARATELLEGLVGARRLTAQALLSTVCRDVANERLGSFPLQPRKKGAPAFAYTGDSISRYITSAAVVFEGAGSGQDPRLTTAWVILGEPAAGVAVPLWVAAGQVPQELAVSPDPSPLGSAFAEVKDLLYPDPRGDLQHYLDVPALADPKEGVLAPLLAVEDGNFRQVDADLEGWRRQLPAAEQMARVEAAIARQTLEAVQHILEARMKSAPGIRRPKPKAPAVQRGPVSVTNLSQ